MPKQLAFLLCSGFVLYLLRLERRQSRGVSPALWIPTIWMLIAASRPVASWFGDGSADTGSLSNQVVLLGLLVAGLLVLSRRRLNWSRVINNNIWLMTLLLYMLVSVVWSEIPVDSFKRWIRELEAVIMALLVLTDPSPRQAMQSVLRRIVYVLIPFSLLLIKYFPAYGVAYGRWNGAYMWVGVGLQKNDFGCLCLISLFFLTWTLVRRWQGKDAPVHKYQTPVEVGLAILTVYLITGPTIQAYSATAVISLGVGLAVFVILFWMRKRNNFGGRNALMLILALGMGYGIVTPFIKGAAYAANPTSGQEQISSLGRDSSFTGRTEIWAGLLPEVENRPILGSGFESFWTPANVAAVEVNEAHNGYLEVLLNLGAIGLLLTVIFLLTSFRKAIRTLLFDFDWACLLLCYILMLVTHNITEASLNSFCNPLTAIILFLSVTFPAAICYGSERKDGEKIPQRRLHQRHIKSPGFAHLQRH